MTQRLSELSAPRKSLSLTDQAVRFLTKQCWPMIPSTGAEKKPCVAWKKYQNQLPTTEQAREWGTKLKPQRWGLVTGRLAGVVVVDFDGAQGRKLMRERDVDPHVRTGSGGFHLYLKHPGWRVPTLNAKTGKVSWPWPGVDIRGDGGFAVLLGRNRSGAYVQLRQLVPEPFEVLPPQVRDFLRNHSEKRPKLTQPIQSAPPVKNCRVEANVLIGMALDMALTHGRNDTGFWLACQLRDNAYALDDAALAMRKYRSRAPSTNLKGAQEPYTEHEMTASLGEAYSRPSREPWGERGPRPHNSSAPRVTPKPQPGKSEPYSGKERSPQGDDADNPGSIGIYVGHTGDPLVGHMDEPLARSQYARLPREVSGDRRLKHRDTRVYAVLARSCWQGNVAQVGKREIAKMTPCAERLVVESLRRLEATGHIQRQPGRRRGQRGRYILLSPIFGQKQRAGLEEVIVTPKGRRRLVSVRKEQGTARTLSGTSSPPADVGTPRRSKGRLERQ
jgi:hypothetical protein